MRGLESANTADSLLPNASASTDDSAPPKVGERGAGANKERVNGVARKDGGMLTLEALAATPIVGVLSGLMRGVTLKATAGVGGAGDGVRAASPVSSVGFGRGDEEMACNSPKAGVDARNAYTSKYSARGDMHRLYTVEKASITRMI